jgi:hypothetical protein
MRTSIVAGSLLAALTLVAPLNGQQVAADVVVRSGPVAGHVVIGDGYSTYRRPVVYRRVVQRVIIVERVHGRHFRHANYWRKHGFRPVVVYYRDGRYYDRYARGGPAVREVVVYERDGRFYSDCDDEYDRNDRSRYDRGDSHGRYDDRDWDD